jgi:hypothetical protein
MAYQPNIPLLGDLISNSQGDLNGNFQAIDAGTTATGLGFSRNHISMTTAGTGGEHYRIDFPDASLVPAPAGTESSIYPALVDAKQELKFKNATNDIKITNSLLAAASGQGMLPGGLQIRIGHQNITCNNTNQDATYSLPFPAATLFAVAVPDNSNIQNIIQFQLGASNPNKAVFGCSQPGGPVIAITYLAIGY